MKTYTINAEDNITVFASAKETDGAGERFASAKELAKLAEGWPAARLVAIWNSLPGGEPVKRFQSRATAVARIWTVIERLEPAVAAVAPPVAPVQARRAQTHATTAPAPHVGREGSKKAAVLALLRRPVGATLAEIMEATGWQPHSVRGFLSGAVGKRMGLTVASAKREDGERVYQLQQ